MASSMKTSISRSTVGRGSIAARRVTPSSRVIARAQTQAKTGLAKWADSVGMPTEDGVFGFTPFAEIWVGRWAMLGFASSIAVEFTSGHGTLQQLSVETPSAPVLAILSTILGGATIVGLARTILRVQTKDMKPTEVERYKEFLGLKKEDENIDSTEAMMKRKGDFTTPPNTVIDNASIAASKAAGAPVDTLLSTSTADAQTAAKEMKAGTSTSDLSSAAAQKQYEDAMYFGAEGELAFARNIEVTNGRWAMMGFLIAIIVEAGNGHGIMGQVIDICKYTGLLGERSGF